MKAIVRFSRQQPLAAAGGAVLVLLALVALLAPLIAFYTPAEQLRAERLQGPSLRHWFGTDNLGRDVFSRVAYGARLSLSIGALATALSGGLGLALGLASAYLGGNSDLLIQRLMDMLFTFPSLVLAIAIVTVLGPAPQNVVLAIALPRLPGTVRVVRAAALSAKGNEYMVAARAVGASPLRQMARHLAPNCMAPFVVYATAQLGTAILVEASLSFLGLGVPPPAPSWGRMLSMEGLRYFEVSPWMALFPGLALSLGVFAVNLLGDGLRDALDPRLRSA